MRRGVHGGHGASANRIDNGQGVNAPADRYSNFLGNGTFLTSYGGLVLPWSLFGYCDVMLYDMVKVN